MLQELLEKNQARYAPVVDFDPAIDRLLLMDFSNGNSTLTPPILKNIHRFCDYITQQIQHATARYGIGGYGEHRTIYAMSPHFDAGEEPRRLHLGIDIWGEAGTKVYAPLQGHIHSFRFNDVQGDYGATIILQHQLEGYLFYTLYGHLSLSSLYGLYENMPVAAGQKIGTFGPPNENGHWPPHLHFQIIENIGTLRGDYPGVCRYSEREKYLANCPDPNLILQLNQFII